MPVAAPAERLLLRLLMRLSLRLLLTMLLCMQLRLLVCLLQRVLPPLRARADAHACCVICFLHVTWRALMDAVA